KDRATDVNQKRPETPVPVEKSAISTRDTRWTQSATAACNAPAGFPPPLPRTKFPVPVPRQAREPNPRNFPPGVTVNEFSTLDRHRKAYQPKLPPALAQGADRVTVVTG